MADVVGDVVTNKHSKGSIVLRSQPRKILAGNMSSQFSSLRNRNNTVMTKTIYQARKAMKSELTDDQDFSMTGTTYYRTSDCVRGTIALNA